MKNYKRKKVKNMAIAIEQVLKIFYLAGAKYPDMENVFGECEEYHRVLESLEKNERVNLIREMRKCRKKGKQSSKSK